MRIAVNCAVCGVPFYRAPSRTNAKFCSRTCQHRHPRARPASELWAKVKKPDDLTDCWEWIGAFGESGYGKFSDRYAHRLAYELTHGPIPKGLVLDHLCRHRWCVNPSHLRVVTIAENVTAPGSQTGAHEGRKTHCIHGHEFTPENTYRHPRVGGRHCKACRRLCDKAHPRAHKTPVQHPSAPL